MSLKRVTHHVPLGTKMMTLTLKVKRDSSTDIGMHVLHTKMHINKHVIYSGVMECGNCVIMPTGWKVSWKKITLI